MAGLVKAHLAVCSAAVVADSDLHRTALCIRVRCVVALRHCACANGIETGGAKMARVFVVASIIAALAGSL